MKLRSEQIILIVACLLALVVGWAVKDILRLDLETDPPVHWQAPAFEPEAFDFTTIVYNEKAWSWAGLPWMYWDARSKQVHSLSLEDKDEYGVPYAWKKKYGLDLFDPRVISQDPDNDGFTNLEEGLADTDPLNAGSRPSALSRLQIVRVQEAPFPARFQGYSLSPDGVYSFQINMDQGTTQVLKQGDSFKAFNKDWRIVDVRFRIIELSTEKKREPYELVLNYRGKELILPLGGTVPSTVQQLTLVREVNGRREFLRVNTEEEWTFEGHRGFWMNIDKEGADFVDSETGKIHRVTYPIKKEQG